MKMFYINANAEAIVFIIDSENVKYVVKLTYIKTWKDLIFKILNILYPKYKILFKYFYNYLKKCLNTFSI